MAIKPAQIVPGLTGTVEIDDELVPLPPNQRNTLIQLAKQLVGPYFDDNTKLVRIQFSTAPTTKTIVFLERNGLIAWWEVDYVDNNLFQNTMLVWGSTSSHFDGFRADITQLINAETQQLSQSYGVTFTFNPDGTTTFVLIGTAYGGGYIKFIITGSEIDEE